MINTTPQNKPKKSYLVNIIFFLIFLSFISLFFYISTPNVSSEKRSNAEVKNIREIVQGIHQLYSKSSDYKGLNNEMIIQAKTVPDKMTDVPLSDKLGNIFGGQVVIEESVSELPGISKVYKISYAEVPDAECQKIVEKIYDDFIQIEVNSAIIKSAMKPQKAQDFKVMLEKACQETVQENTLVFYGN